MISYLSGKPVYLGGKYVILDIGGVGYKVFINEKTYDILSKNEDKVKQKTITLYTRLNFNSRDNQVDIYGFLDPEEFSSFELLISVSGIGPKNALQILSSVEPERLQEAVVKGDSDYLIKVGGLGPKTAARLVVELKGKFKSSARSKTDLGTESEALDALVALGYGRLQALEALKKVKGEASTEVKVTETLKILSS